MLDGYMTMTQIGDRIGVDAATVRTYNARATANRRAGAPLPGDLPPPDGHAGPTPLWKTATIEEWIASRPGRGAGGGRPRRGDA